MPRTSWFGLRSIPVSVRSAPFRRTVFRLQPEGMMTDILLLPGEAFAENVQSSAAGAGGWLLPNEMNIVPTGMDITDTRNAEGTAEGTPGGSRRIRPVTVIGASAARRTSAISWPPTVMTAVA